MDTIIRGLVVYFFLLVVFRLSGRRSLSQSSDFNLVLLLIISETTQEAMVDSDHSITNSFLLILTLVGTSLFLSSLKARSPVVERLLDDTPVIILDSGRLLSDRMKKLRYDESDIMKAARASHGLERLEQIKYAIAETNGEISIIPN